MRYQGSKKRGFARLLRKQFTKSEQKLWRYLRNRNVMNFKFRRQVPFGSYFLDFYCAEKKIGIELDGSQHFSSEGRTKDTKRDNFLSANGLKVLRYSDRDVLLNSESVLKDIIKNMESSPCSSPFQREENQEVSAR